MSLIKRALTVVVAAVVLAIATALVAAPERSAHAFMVAFPSIAFALDVDRPCVTGHPSVRCRFVAAPLDPARPDGPHIRIATTYARVDDRSRVRGLLVFDLGGPDHRFVDPRADTAYLRRTFDRRYDIATIDVRGVGLSGPLEPCPAVERAHAALDAAPLEDRAAIKRAFLDDARACAGDDTVRAHLSLRHMASDVDAVRAALGAERVAFVGVSFGGALALAYAHHYPERTDALVVDSPVPYGRLDHAPPLALGDEEALRALDDEAVRALATWLPFRVGAFTEPHEMLRAVVVMLAGTCLSWSECPLAPRPVPRMFDVISRAVDVTRDAPPFERAVADNLIDAMSHASTMGEEAKRILAILHGIERGFQEDDVPPPPAKHWKTTRDEADAIRCAAEPLYIFDFFGGRSVDELERAPLDRRLARRALPCVHTPPESPRFELPSNVPVVFFAGTHDWLTPIVQTRAFAHAARVPLVVVEGTGHGALFSGPCANEVLRRALVERDPPTADVFCARW